MFIAVVLAFISAIALIVLTTPRGGIPRWKYIVYDWRWRLMTAASLAPTSVTGALGQLLNLPVERLHLDGTSLFHSVADTAAHTRADRLDFLCSIGRCRNGYRSDLYQKPGLQIE